MSADGRGAAVEHGGDPWEPSEAVWRETSPIIIAICLDVLAKDLERLTAHDNAVLVREVARRLRAGSGALPWPEGGPDPREISAAFASWTVVAYFEEDGWTVATYDDEEWSEGWGSDEMGRSFDSVTTPTHYAILPTPEVP
jgi:hypothetical protein